LLNQIQLQNFPNAFNDILVQAKIGSHNVETYNNKYIPQRRGIVTINLTVINSNILNDQQIDFRVESDIIDRIGGVGCQLRIAYFIHQELTLFVLVQKLG
jgi:hypothetical protein